MIDAKQQVQPQLAEFIEARREVLKACDTLMNLLDDYVITDDESESDLGADHEPWLFTKHEVVNPRKLS